MARAEERWEGKGREGKGSEGKGKEEKGDELVHLKPILGFRFEMTEGLEWLGRASSFGPFGPFHFQSQKSV
jgi:hypothetical protein